jgi:hypothetical protein
MEKIPKYIVLTLIIASALLSIKQFRLGTEASEFADGLSAIWTLIFSVLVGVWTERDNSGARFSKPFEFGFFVYLFWPLILPYYLFKTRGVKGLLFAPGFFVLYSAPYIAWFWGWSQA